MSARGWFRHWEFAGVYGPILSLKPDRQRSKPATLLRILRDSQTR
jgi:hypothetical protein